MATNPQKPSMQQGTPTPTVSAVTPPPFIVRSKATVEIETMAKGTPKVTVRVDDDDPNHAAEVALSIYSRMTWALEHDEVE